MKKNSLNPSKNSSYDVWNITFLKTKSVRSLFLNLTWPILRSSFPLRVECNNGRRSLGVIPEFCFLGTWRNIKGKLEKVFLKYCQIWGDWRGGHQITTELWNQIWQKKKFEKPACLQVIYRLIPNARKGVFCVPVRLTKYVWSGLKIMHSRAQALPTTNQSNQSD